MSKTEEIIEDLRRFSPSADGDWSEFVELLDDLWKTKDPQKAYKTLFDLLVKYDDDYMECQWGIVHGMEYFGGYESELVESLRIKPAQLTLVMLSRMINSGEKKIAGGSIATLLEEIIERLDDRNKRLIEFAQDCKARLDRTSER